NSFTKAEDGSTDLLVYHARTYREIVGDPLWNPDRHTFVKPIKWGADGLPDFGRPSCVEGLAGTGIAVQAVIFDRRHVCWTGVPCDGSEKPAELGGRLRICYC